jgi:hypothetical protein
MQVDLPAFERPTKANSGKFSAGKKSSEGAVVKNLAVCIQPMAIFSAAAFSVLAICAGVGSIAVNADVGVAVLAGEFDEDVVITSIRTAMSAVLMRGLVGNYQNSRKPARSL